MYLIGIASHKKWYLITGVTSVNVEHISLVTWADLNRSLCDVGYCWGQHDGHLSVIIVKTSYSLIVNLETCMESELLQKAFGKLN